MPRSTRKAAPTSTPNCIAPGRQACKTASTSTQTACPLAPGRQARKAAPQTACPLAPGRQARKAAPTSTPNCMAPGAKQHPPAPQTACPPCPLAPGRQARKAASTTPPNCMPPSTRPSSSQSSIHQHLKLHAPQHPAVKLAKQHPPAPQTACPLAPNCMPPSTRPSISQITFPSLLKVRNSFQLSGETSQKKGALFLAFFTLVGTRQSHAHAAACFLPPSVMCEQQ